MSARGAIAVVLSLAALLLAAPGALAATFTVGDTGNGADADAGDGVCEVTAATGDCTLRAAIGEANQLDGADVVHFDTGAMGSDLITVTSALPAIDDQLEIDGCNGGAVVDPCVELVGGGAGFGALTVDASDSAIRGLAMNGFALNQSVVSYEAGNDGLQMQNNWLGIALDEDPIDIGLGIELNGGGAQIGGTSPDERNVVARTNTGPGIRVESGDDNVISGNYFGTDPDGDPATGFNNSFPAIELLGDPGDTDRPTGTVIGGTVAPAEAATAACDGACNLISNSNVQAIDLTGTGASPAGETTIAGNYIGLAQNGNGDSGSGDHGIFVGQAEPVTIGGPSAGDRNYIAGNNGGGIDATAAGLTVRNNYLGLDFSGTTVIADGATELVSSGNANGPISIRDNLIGGSTGVRLQGDGATVTGNTIGIGTGGEDVLVNSAVTVTGTGNTVGGAGAGDANALGNAGSAIAISNTFPGGEGDDNTVQGNFIGTDQGGAVEGNASYGVAITGTSDGNLVGGDTAAEENVISNSGLGAVLVEDPNAIGNTVARNRGSANAAPFIDLSPSANGSVATPSIDPGPTSEVVSGAGAEPGATVRVYRTAEAAGGNPTGLIAFLGQTVALGDGSWSLACPDPPECPAEAPGAGQLTANQTDTDGNSSELAPATSYTAVAPDTAITSGPGQGATTGDSTPTFGFSSTEAGSTFQCKLDGGAFGPCTSPRTLGPLTEGQHTFEVKATDPVGNEDATPASRTFTIDVPAPPPAGDTDAPETAITKAPKDKLKAKRKTAKATYEFSSDESGSTFECALDGDPFQSCASPLTEKVKKGKHTFEVRAIDSAGNIDPTPADDDFKVKKKKKKKK